MQTFVIGDIHGALKALEELLQQLNLQEQDTLIFLGDYVDGYSDSPAVLDYLIQLEHEQTCVFLRGNHDELLLNWLNKGAENTLWLQHGGLSTVEAYKNTTSSTKLSHRDFLERLKPYYLENNRLFVHAGFTNLKGVQYEIDSRPFSWDRTLWELALSVDTNLAVDSNRYPKRLKLYQEIYIGHTPVTQIGANKPTNFANVWNIDTGAGFGNYLSALEISSKKIYQSSKISDLYPLETGRTA